jgi:uncharacterized protein YfaS (alpha-2-macroglobulin family)
VAPPLPPKPSNRPPVFPIKNQINHRLFATNTPTHTPTRFFVSLSKQKGNIFAVTSRFELPDTSSRYLQAGVEVNLIVRVEVKKDAEYVMLEVPIPAGCTYASKPLARGKEVHREYFREQCSIFCRDLQAGSYEFRIPLLPQFSGSYTLNPAKTEMMYFPVFFGRNAGKRVQVGGK